MKRFSCILCIAVLVINLFSSFVFAEESERMKIVYDEQLGLEYLKDNETGEKTYKAYEVNSSGELVEISLEECKRIKDNIVNDISFKNNTISPIKPMTPDTYEKYRYEGETVCEDIVGSTRKVTPDVKGPAKISYGVSKTINHSFSIGISSLISAIKSEASFTWNKSASTNKSFGTSFNVPSKEVGYVAFSPYMNKTGGEYYIDTYTGGGVLLSTEYGGYAYGYSPKTVGDWADGLYELKLK